MVAKSVKWALASLVVFPPAAFALGLGEVRLLSSLNAPLDAEIELIGATPEEMQTLKAQIASRETFARYGLDWPAQLGTVTLTPVRKPDGTEVIRLRTAETITEPFLTLLVEVNWARGRLVREYTMLLDPPVYAPAQQQAAAPVAAPSVGEGTRAGQIARTPPPARETPAPAATPSESPARAEPSASAAGSSRTVRPGDTLSEIASEIAGGDSAQTRAWMLAIYRNNPAAFDGNMNILRSGAVLRIPDNSVVAAISPAEASAEIRRQYAAWRGSTAASAPSAAEPGRLRLVTPTDQGGGGATAGASAQTEQLQSRVRELEAQLAESRRLLELRNAEVAQLQARLAAQSGAPAPAAPAAEAAPEAPLETEIPSDAPEATPPSEQPEQPAAASAEEEQPAAAAEEQVAQAEPAPAPAQRPATTPPAAEEEGSLFDTLASYWWAALAVIVALLGLLGLRVYRARQRNEFDDSLSRLQAGSADAFARESSGDTQPLRAPERDEAFVVEETGTHERPRFAGDAAVPAARHVPADETISSDAAINLDQGDPLAEADFHMAYGLYDQAADLVRIAISREPHRRDLKLKLLEVFFVWGNKEQFLQTARELAETRDEAQSGEWEKIVIMGKQLAPEDPLFAGSGGGSLGGVDLDLEGGQSRVDFDLAAEGGAAGADAIDLDIGSALGEKEPDRDSQTATDHNLALHEDAFLPDSGTGTTREMTQKLPSDNSPTMVAFGADIEAPTVEQPALYGGNNPTVRQKLETALKHSGAPEPTAELAIDDLGLDLSALDTMDQPSLAATQESPTLVAGLDERSRRIMDEAERRGGFKDIDATAISATGSWNLSSEDLDPTLPPTRVGLNGSGAGAAAADGAETSRLEVGSDLDFNFNEAEGAARVTNGSGAPVDLDVGTATVPDAAFTSTQKLSADDLALPDLEPVTMSEVGTKLDLARAYMDMGDPEGARNILEEVMQEGSVAQKQEAQRLLESLPG